MSGTGRPQYITKKGSTDPAQSYLPSRQVMTRSMPGHRHISYREKQDFSKEDLKSKLADIDTPKVKYNDSSDYDDSDSESVATSETDSEDNQQELIKTLVQLKKEKEEEKTRELTKAQISQLNKPNYDMTLNWMDQSVFGNSTSREPKEKSKYVNDPVRSRYHKEFLGKYIRS